MDGSEPATRCVGPDRNAHQCGPARACRAVAYAALALALATAVPAAAHPLGNDSITHFNVLYVLPDRLEVDYLLDLAENPTQFVESAEMDSDKDGQVSREEQERWLDRKIAEYASFLVASIDGTPLPLSLVPEQVDPTTGARLSTSKIIVPMLGPMGMTYRIVIRYMARYPDTLGPGEHVIAYEDKTYPQHRGLKLVLLEPTPFLCRLYDIPAGVLQPGPVPPAIASALADEALGLQEPATARLEPAARAVDGRPRWRLSDGDRQLSLTVRDDAIDVTVLPYCEFIAPDVPLVSDDNAAFRYEQYDPVNLPDVRRASVRFTVVGEPGRISRSASPVPPASRAAGETAPAVASNAAPTDPSLPQHASNFLDPNYNPIKRSEYERQAQRMIGLLQGRWSLPLLLLITALAFGWGAAHALMPGHAKTVVAAYLISQRGTYWHAAVLAVIVTVTHTALVVIMGLVIWYFQESNPRLAPALQLWLGLIAGLLVMSMGGTLLWRAATGRLGAHGHDHGNHHHGPDNRPWWRRLFTHSHPHVPGVEHSHAHEHGHGHPHDHSHAHVHEHGHAHSHGHVHTHDHAHAHVPALDHAHAHDGHSRHHGQAGDHAHPPGHVHAHDHGHGHVHGTGASGRGVDQLAFRMLLVLGVTGGIVPCPSATIIMFLGIGANVVPGALYAIAIFSLGLALTLMLIGSLALASRRYAAKVLSDARHEHQLSGTGRRILLQIVPAFSGFAVVALGGMIAVHYVCLMRGVASPFPWMG